MSAVTTDVSALIDAVRTAGLELAASTRTEQRVTDDWFAGRKQHDEVKAARTEADAAAYEFGRAIGRLQEAVR